jgi:hypothetical protein
MRLALQFNLPTVACRDPGPVIQQKFNAVFQMLLFNYFSGIVNHF